jgi:hypothetical protein
MRWMMILKEDGVNLSLSINFDGMVAALRSRAHTGCDYLLAL